MCGASLARPCRGVSPPTPVRFATLAMFFALIIWATSHQGWHTEPRHTGSSSGRVNLTPRGARASAANRSPPPRPYIWRFTVFSRLTCPSVCPLLHSSTSPAYTAALSSSKPAANRCRSASSLAATCAIQASSSVPRRSRAIVVNACAGVHALAIAAIGPTRSSHAHLLLLRRRLGATHEGHRHLSRGRGRRAPIRSRWLLGRSSTGRRNSARKREHWYRSSEDPSRESPRTAAGRRDSPRPSGAADAPCIGRAPRGGHCGACAPAAHRAGCCPEDSCDRPSRGRSLPPGQYR